MRVALVITELEVGGAEKSLTHLALGLAGRGFLPVVYSLAPRPRPGRDQLVTRLETAAIPLHFIGVRRPWHAWQAVGQLRQLLAQQAAQLVQTFLFHANVLGVWAARQADVPRIVTGVRVADRRRGRLMLERAVLPWVDRVCCVSQGAADILAGRSARRRQLTVIIPNGIDVDALEAAALAGPPPADWTSTSRRALYVGRLDPQKGVDWLVESWRQAAPQLPGWELVLVGDGPQRASLELAVAAGGEAARVHLLGWRPDVPVLMRHSQLLLLASRWEGMPNVLLEAMALGLPVLATRAEGVADLLGPGAEQQSVPLGDRSAFVARLAAIAAHPAATAAWGAANQQRARQAFSLDAMVDAYAELYRTLQPPNT